MKCERRISWGATATARAYVQQFQHGLTLTDEERAAAGITITAKTKTPTSPAAILEITPPRLLLDFSIRHQGVIRKMGDTTHIFRAEGAAMITFGVFPGIWVVAVCLGKI